MASVVELESENVSQSEDPPRPTQGSPPGTPTFHFSLRTGGSTICICVMPKNQQLLNINVIHRILINCEFM